MKADKKEVGCRGSASYCQLRTLAGIKDADKNNQCKFKSPFEVNLRNHTKVDHKKKVGYREGASYCQLRTSVGIREADKCNQ